jgi:uncharacterized protein (TIGR02145 family)
MKRKSWIHCLVFAGFLLLLAAACKKDDKTDDSSNNNNNNNNPPVATTVTDIDGNVYNIIIIGTQTWMKENLEVKHYNNGDSIPFYSGGGAEWVALTTGGCCYYYNDPYNGYGLLYNGYAVYDSRKIAPVGWHVATDADWNTLITYLGGDSIAGGKMKSTGTSLWDSPNTGATNSSNFTALPGGYRETMWGYFWNESINAIFWSQTDGTGGNYRKLGNLGKDVTTGHYSNGNGLSVRCVKN